MEEVHSLKGFFKNIEHTLEHLKVVYDIGAYKGSWTQEVSDYLPKDTKFYMFEPNTEHTEDLEKTKHPFYNVLLSDAQKEVDFYKTTSTGDSYYKEKTIFYDNVVPVKMQAETLDEFVAKNNLPKPDILKIDTQGSELDILRGATDCLKNSKVVILECPIQPYNSGAPNLDSVVSYMVENGLAPYFITEIHTFGIPIYQIDIAFVRIS